MWWCERSSSLAVQIFLKKEKLSLKLCSLNTELKTHERCTEKDILVLVLLVVIPGLWSGDCSSKGLTGYIWATCVTIYCCLFRNFCSIFLRRPWPFSADSNLLASYNHKIKYPGEIYGRYQPCRMQQARSNTCKGRMHITQV